MGGLIAFMVLPGLQLIATFVTAVVLGASSRPDKRYQFRQLGKLFLGLNRQASKMNVVEGADHIGELQAWDLKTGQKVWTYKYKYMNWGPVLTTAGGLVFSGGSNDRYFRAFDAKNGEVLWEFRTNSGVTAVPSTYAVDGIQYIAVQSGWGVDAQRMQGRLDTFYGTTTWVPQGGVLWVFAIKE